MEELVNNLIDAFGEGIDELDWMTDETKARAQEKREKFTYKIGYPDLWRDYSLLSIVRDDLIGNIKRANRFEYQRNINKLRRPDRPHRVGDDASNRQRLSQPDNERDRLSSCDPAAAFLQIPRPTKP